MKHLAIGFALALSLGFASGANAGVLNWSFNYSGTGVTASGIITTSDTPNAFLPAPAYDIVGISGLRNGIAITGIVPPSGVFASGFGFNYDNVLYSADPFFDVNGMLYTDLNSEIFNVWYNANTPGYAANSYYESVLRNGNYVNTILTDGSIEQVPEPAPIMLVGLALLSLFGFAFVRSGYRPRPR